MEDVCGLLICRSSCQTILCTCDKSLLFCGLSVIEFLIASPDVSTSLGGIEVRSDSPHLEYTPLLGEEELATLASCDK